MNVQGVLTHQHCLVGVWILRGARGAHARPFTAYTGFKAIGKWGRNHFPVCPKGHRFRHSGSRRCSTSSSTTASLLASSTRRAGRGYRSSQSP